MKIDKLGLYHRLPHFMKTIAVNIRGAQLHYWRYGCGINSERLIQEALEKDSWSKREWDLWRQTRLSFILNRAVKKVPYYRDYWQRQRRVGNRASWEYLENWPTLEKEQLRGKESLFVADDCSRTRMFVDHTGGTTGTPLNIYIRRDIIHQWYAINEARIRRWHGHSISQPWGIFGGQVVIPITQKKPPYWVKNHFLNQIYYSSNHVSELNTKFFVESFWRYQPSHLVVYPSSLTLLAKYIKQQKIKVPKSIKTIFSNAERLFPHQKKVIEEVFNSKVINTYGMGEMVFGASECEFGKLHTWPDSGYLEVWDEKSNKIVDTPGQVGEFLMTGLINPDMILIRYRVGDVGSVPENVSCACGRHLPVMKELNGRTNDVVTALDGRKVFWLNSIFYELPIVEAQIIQLTLEKILVKIIPDSGFEKQHAIKMTTSLKKRVGDVDVDIQLVDAIPRTKASKFKSVISHVKPEN